MSTPEPAITPGQFPGLSQASADHINTHVRADWRESFASRPELRTCPSGADCQDKTCVAMHPFTEAQQTQLALLFASPVPPAPQKASAA